MSNKTCSYCHGTGRIKKMSGETDCHHCDWNGAEIDDFDDDEIDEHDCGLMPNGQCTLAGTEFCDWDCGRLG